MEFRRYIQITKYEYDFILKEIEDYGITYFNENHVYEDEYVLPADKYKEHSHLFLEKRIESETTYYVWYNSQI